MHIAARTTHPHLRPRSRRRRPLAAAGLVLAMVLAAGNLAGAAEAPVGLGTATSFAVLGGSTVTNTGPTLVSGDLGVSPGSAVTGFPPGLVTAGTIHAADAVALQAQNDVVTAYNDAAGRTTTAAVTADLAGQTLVGGVYTGPTLALNGTLTLDGEGDTGAVFIFQAASTLITGSASSIVLIGGAQACNVYWQIGSSATLGTGSTFRGTVLALTSIGAMTGATIDGRLFARNGAVTLDTNTVTRSACAAPPGTTTTTVPGTGSTTTTAGTGTTTTTTAGPATTTTTTVGGGTTTSTADVLGQVTSTSSSTIAGGASSTSSTTGSTTVGNGNGSSTSTTASLTGGPTAPTTAMDTTDVGRPSLPVTGGATVVTTAVGLLAIAGGSAALVSSRRRAQPGS